MPPFLLGVNYWPRASAMAMWSRFDAGAIAEDFAQIASLGLGVVRFFLRWDAFQPEADRLDRAMLDRLDAVLDAIAAHGLVAMPTLFTGHMSGVNWLPAWALDPRVPAGRFRTIANGRVEPYGIGDFYTGALLDAQRLQARVLGERYRGHPAILAWDLGNEFSNLRAPRTITEGVHWSRVLTDDLRDTSGHAVTGGIHGEDLTQDRNIRPSSFCGPWAFATMHGYSVYSHFALGRLDARTVPFLNALTTTFARKPTLFSEFGNPGCPPGKRSPFERVPLPDEPPAPEIAPDDPVFAQYACLDETEMAQYARETIDRLHGDGALGAMWWCWTDYAPSLRNEPPFDRAPHEMRFGLLRDDGSAKPVADVLRAIASERRMVVEPSRTLAIDEDAYYANLPVATNDAYARYREES